jgi:hypothetical protein
MDISLMHLLQQLDTLATLSLFVGAMPALMAAAYALWPTEAKLALMRPLSLASIFAGLTGFVTGLINVLFRAVTESGMPPPVGLAVALVPLCSAFGFLTVAWLLVALGLRRTA